MKPKVPEGFTLHPLRKGVAILEQHSSGRRMTMTALHYGGAIDDRQVAYCAHRLEKGDGVLPGEPFKGSPE